MTTVHAPTPGSDHPMVVAAVARCAAVGGTPRMGVPLIEAMLDAGFSHEHCTAALTSMTTGHLGHSLTHTIGATHLAAFAATSTATLRAAA